MVKNGQMGEEVVAKHRAKMLELIQEAEEQQRIYAKKQKLIQAAKNKKPSTKSSGKDPNKTWRSVESKGGGRITRKKRIKSLL
jgi:hypothetical protein